MTDQDANMPDELEPMPDRETPLAEILGEEFLEAEEDFDDEEEILVDEVEKFTATASRRIPPDANAEDLLEGRDDRASAHDRMEQDQPEIVRQQREGRLTLLPLALGFIGVGSLLLADRFADNFKMESGVAVVLLIASLMLTYIFRFFSSGRRERGLFFIAMVLLGWGTLFGLNVITDGEFSLDRFWPLFVSSVGVAFILTFMFERTHQIGLLFPAILLIYSSGIAVLTTQDIISPQVQDAVVNYGALVVAFIGLTLIPTAIQDR